MEEFNIPTIKEIDDYIKLHNLAVKADFVEKYWGGRNWLTTHKMRPKTLSSAIDYCNGLYIQQNKRDKGIEEFQKHRREYKYFDPYKEQLKSKEWIAFRKFIFAVRGTKCEICGCGGNNLQIHHKHYVNGKKAWEYTSDELMVVCPICHKTIHKIK